MPDISGSVKKLYNLLIKDPDYQDTPSKSREEVVLGEATQRAKQHERNNIALSLAKSSSTHTNGSHAVADLSNFLVKAAKARAPRVAPKAMLTQINPKQTLGALLDPLIAVEGTVAVLDKITKGLPTEFIDRLTDLEIILPKIEKEGEAKFDIDTFKASLIMLSRYIEIESIAGEKLDPASPYFNAELRHYLLSDSGPVYIATDEDINDHLGGALERLDYVDEGLYGLLQTERANLAKDVQDHLKSYPSLKEAKTIVSKVTDKKKEISLKAAQKENSDAKVGDLSGGWRDHLPADRLAKYSQVPETSKALIARASERLLTPDGTAGIVRWFEQNGGVYAALESTVPATVDLGFRYMNMLKQTTPGQEAAFKLYADGTKNNKDALNLQNLDTEDSKTAAIDKHLRILKRNAKLLRIQESQSQRFLEFLIKQTNLEEKLDEKTIQEKLFEGGKLKTAAQIVSDPAVLRRLSHQYAQETPMEDEEKYDTGEVIPTTALLSEEEQEEMAQSGELDEYGVPINPLVESQDEDAWKAEAYEGVEESEGFIDPYQELQDDATTEGMWQSLKAGRQFRQDFSKVAQNGWLGMDRVEDGTVWSHQALIKSIYDLEGVAEVFLYGESVDDLIDNPQRPDKPKPMNIGVRLDPKQDVNADAIQKILEKSPEISPKVFKAASYNDKAYKEFGPTVVFYGEEFPKSQEALFGQITPLLETDVIGGHGSKQPLTIDQSVIDGPLSELWGKEEGARIVIEGVDFKISPELAYKIAVDNEDIKELRQQQDKFRGLSSEPEMGSALDHPGVKTMTGQYIVSKAENLADPIFSDMIDSFLPKSLQNLGDEERDVWGQLLNILYGAEDDARESRPTTRTEFLETIPTLYHELRRERGRGEELSTEDRHSLSRDADKSGRYWPKTLSVPIPESLNTKTYHKVVQDLIDDDDKLLELEIKQPGLQAYTERIDSKIDKLIQDYTKRTFKKVRQDIVYYDESGKRIVLGSAFPNLTRLLDVEDRELEEDIDWSVYPVKFIDRIFAEKLDKKEGFTGEPLSGALVGKNGKYLNESKRRGAEILRIEALQEVIDAEPDKEQQALAESGLVAFPDFGHWDVLRDKHTNDPISNTSKHNLDVQGNPTLTRILTEMGYNPNTYSASYFNTSPIVTQKNEQGQKGRIGLTALITSFKEDVRSRFKANFKLRTYSSTFASDQLTPSQKELRKTLNEASIAKRDAYLAAHQQLTSTPEELREFLTGFSFAGEGILGGQTLSDLILERSDQYNNGQISRKNLLPKKAQTLEEHALVQKELEEHRRGEDGKELFFDLDNPDLQKILKYLYVEKYPNQKLPKKLPDNVKARFEEARQWPVRTIEISGEEIDVPIISAKELAKVREAVNETDVEKGVIGLAKLIPQIMGSIEFDTALATAFTEWQTDARGAVHIYTAIQAQAEKERSKGLLDMLPKYFDSPNDEGIFRKKFSAFKAVAQSLGYDTVKEMFVQEHILIPESPTEIRLAAPLSDSELLERNSHINIESLTSEEVQTVIQSLRQAAPQTFEEVPREVGKEYLPIDRSDLQSFLNKILANSKMAETGDRGQEGEEGKLDNGRYPNHYIDDELEIQELSDMSSAKQDLHKINPTIIVLRRFASGPHSGLLGFQKLYDHGFEGTLEEGNYKPIFNQRIRYGDASDKMSSRLTGEKSHLLQVGASGAYGRWSWRRKNEGLTQPTTAALDFKPINSLLAKYGIPVQFNSDIDTANEEAVRQWIVENHQKIAMLTELGYRNLRFDNIEDEQAYRSYLTQTAGGDIGRDSGNLLPAFKLALNQVTLGSANSVESRLNGPINYLHPHGTQAERNARQNSFVDYMNTPVEETDSAYEIQRRHELNMLWDIQQALAYAPVENLQQLYGEHISPDNKLEPVAILKRTIDRIKERGRQRLALDPAFEYDKQVNDAVNRKLSGMYDDVGRFDREVLSSWEDQPKFRTPEDAVNVLPDAFLEAQQRILEILSEDMYDLEEQVIDGDRILPEERVDAAIAAYKARSTEELQGYLKKLALKNDLESLSLETLRSNQSDIPEDIFEELVDEIVNNRTENKRASWKYRQEPQFMTRGSGSKHMFEDRKSDEGIGRRRLGDAGMPAKLLPEEEISPSLGTGLPMGGGMAILESIDVMEGMGDIPEEGKDYAYIKLGHGGQVVGHLVRDNGTWSIWRALEYSSPGIGGGGNALELVSGEKFRPIKSGLSFGEAKAAMSSNIEWIDPSNPNNLTGTWRDEEQAGAALPSVLSKYLGRVDPSLLKEAEDMGITRDTIEELLTQYGKKEIITSDTVISNKEGVELTFLNFLNDMTDKAIEKAANPEADKQLSFDALLDDSEAVDPDAAAAEVVDPDTAAAEVVDPDTKIPVPLAHQLRELKGLQNIYRRYRVTINEHNEELLGDMHTENNPEAWKTTVSDLPVWEDAIPLLLYLLDESGNDFDFDHIEKIDDKFVELGFHSFFDPKDENKQTVHLNSTRPDYSGMAPFFTKLGALVAGHNFEPTANEGIELTQELKNSLYDIFNPKDGEPFIEGLDLRKAAEKNQSVENIDQINNLNENAAKEDAGGVNTEENPKRYGQSTAIPEFLRDASTQAEIMQKIESSGYVPDDLKDKAGNLIFTDKDEEPLKVAPWKVSNNVVAQLAQRGFTVAPDILEEIDQRGDIWSLSPQAKSKETKQRFTWDQRLYLANEDGTFNENFLGIGDEAVEVNPDVKEAQNALLRQLLTATGNVKHLHNQPKEGHASIIDEFRAENLQGWDKAARGEAFGPQTGATWVDEDGNEIPHPHRGKLPRLLTKEFDLKGIFEKLDAGTFGDTPDMHELNLGHSETMGFIPIKEVGKPISKPSPTDEEEQKRIEAEKLEAEIREAERLEAERLEAEKVAQTQGKEGVVPTSAWDALSEDEQKALGSLNQNKNSFDVLDSATQQRLKEFAIPPKAAEKPVVDAGAGAGAGDPVNGDKKPVAIPPEEPKEPEKDPLVVDDHLHQVMAKQFGADWKGAMMGAEVEQRRARKQNQQAALERQDAIRRLYAHYQDEKAGGRKALMADYKTEIIDPIRKPKETPDAGDVSIEDLKKQFIEVYKKYTTSAVNPKGLEPSTVPESQRELESRISDFNIKINQKAEETVDKRHKEKANDLSAINNGQIPEGLSARVLRQYARKAVLHQALYDAEPDNKGKPYMDSESKEMLRAFWLDMGNRTDENGNELVPFNEMRDELVKDGEEGLVSYTNVDGEEVEGHAFMRRIDEEEQLMRQAEENHEALVNQLNEEGVEALTYPVNGHNILVSPDGQDELELGANGEFNYHEGGRNRDAYTGNLLDENGEKRITQAPQVFGLNFENDEDKIRFKELWNNYYQISNTTLRAQRGKAKAGYHPETVADAKKRQQALEQELLEDYGPKGFKQSWLRAARAADQHGSVPMKRNKLGFPVDEKGKPLPLPKVIDPETGEEVDGWYSPSLHAIVNERYFRTLVQESGKYGTNPLYGNHEKVKINQADIRRRFKESVGANLDMDKPEERAKLQLIQPLDGSPLNESRAVMLTKEGGIYHVRSLAEYTPPSKGPVNPAVFRELVLMHKIADEMATNPEAFTGEIANTLGFSGMQRGTTLDENSLAGDQEALLQTKPVKDMVERSPFARRAAEQHKQNLQASPTARFLASLGGYPREVAARVPAGRILTALARGGVQDFTGNELIPATQTQKNVEEQMAKLRQEALDAQQRSDVAHILYKPELEKPLPTKEVTDPETKEKQRVKYDPLEQYRYPPEIESPLETGASAVGSAVGKLGRFIGRKGSKREQPRELFTPPSSMPVEES